MKIWLIILAGGLLTYLIRLFFILVYGRMKMPELMRRALRFIPPAVLSAIIFPELFIRAGRMDITGANPRLWAGLLAALVAWKTRNAVLTIVTGMGVLLLLQALL